MPWNEGSVMDERLRFVARMLDGEDMLTAVLSRQGLFTWKLTAVRIPGLIRP